MSGPREGREPLRPRRVALVSLGCPKNQVDGELILGRLRADGCELVDDPDNADTLVVNTCAFIDNARTESVEALLEASAWKDRLAGRTVIAAGCLVQRSGAELAAEIPELDGLLGLDEIADAPARVLAAGAGATAAAAPAPSLRKLPSAPPIPSGPAVKLFTAADPRVRLSPRWTAYVKIAEGCDQKCSFCAIPTFRGRMRSRPLEDLGAELAQLAREGVVEANFIAQDSTGYGRDIGLRDGLAALVRHVDALDEAPDWLRIHYLYPGRITRGFLEAAAGARRLVPYIDLPLQHADAGVLRRMNRPGDADAYLRQLDALRAALPGAGVRSSFIVGFPGETDDEFATLCDFVGSAGFDAVGVFTYSHEESTTAFALPDDVPPGLKQERRDALEEIALAAAHERNDARVGTTLEVLVEGPAEDRPDALQGRWRGQAPEVDGRVLIEWTGAGADARTPKPGERVPVTITGAAPTELYGRLAGEGAA